MIDMNQVPVMPYDDMLVQPEVPNDYINPNYGITPSVMPTQTVTQPTQIPGMGQGTSKWPEWESQYGVNPSEDWYRNPQWGGHVIWNQDYGYQDYPTVGNLYQGDQGLGGLTSQLGGSWQDYFPGREVEQNTAGQQQQLPGNWQDMANQWSQWLGQNQQGGQVNLGDWRNVGQTQEQQSQSPILPNNILQGGTGGFQYPSQWDTASDVMTQFAQGLPTQIPWQWQQGSDIASQMAQTGMPTSYEPMYQQAKSIAERDTQRAIDQASEQAGLQGLRWSTPLGQTAQRIAGENMANLGLGFAGQEMGALEAARGRQMGGVGQLQGFGAGTAGLTEAAKNRGMQAAGGLTGLGQQYLDAPQDWASQMYQMGAGMQQQGQSALDRYRQDYMRMAPEFNPWTQQAMTYWGTPSQMGYQQYHPSVMSQAMGGAGNIGMMAAGLGGLCGP